MIRYKNKLTGAVIETECECSGENWERANKPVPAASKETKPKKAESEKAVKDDAK